MNEPIELLSNQRRKNEQEFDSNTFVDSSRRPYNMQVLFSSHKVTYVVDSLSRLKVKKYTSLGKVKIAYIIQRQYVDI